MSDKPCSYLPIFDGREKIKVSKDDTNYNTITDYMNNIMPDGSPRFTWNGRNINNLPVVNWDTFNGVYPHDDISYRARMAYESLPNNEPSILSGVQYWDSENKIFIKYDEETHNWLKNDPRSRRKTPSLNFNN